RDSVEPLKRGFEGDARPDAPKLLNENVIAQFAPVLGPKRAQVGVRRVYEIVQHKGAAGSKIGETNIEIGLGPFVAVVAVHRDERYGPMRAPEFWQSLARVAADEDRIARRAESPHFGAHEFRTGIFLASIAGDPEIDPVALRAGCRRYDLCEGSAAPHANFDILRRLQVVPEPI